MMPRVSRRIDEVQKKFAEDFTVVNGNLLLCKVGSKIKQQVHLTIVFIISVNGSQATLSPLFSFSFVTQL